MKRIDDLAGAKVDKVVVGRGGKVYLYLQDADGGWVEWRPIVAELPREPRRRKRRARRKTRP